MHIFILGLHLPSTTCLDQLYRGLPLSSSMFHLILWFEHLAEVVLALLK